MINRMLPILAVVSMLGACSTVTIQPDPIAKQISEPSYEDSKPFFLWGLVGEERVDVQQICEDNSVIQMQSQQTFQDGLLSLVTLGIFSPHTVKVWCEQTI
ncbi:MAG: Bor family protein [Pseudomonadales bacterium]|jgi:hypothetical protein